MISVTEFVMCIDENVNGTSIGAEVVNSDQAFVYAQSVSEQMVTVMMTMIMPQQHEWVGYMNHDFVLFMLMI